MILLLSTSIELVSSRRQRGRLPEPPQVVQPRDRYQVVIIYFDCRIDH
jgi:hypothetical protein